MPLYTKIRLAGSPFPIYVPSVRVQYGRTFVRFHTGGGRWFASSDVQVIRH